MTPTLPEPIVIARRVGDIRIHTFISTYVDDNLANATHIIESKNVLVLVDAQFLIPYATKFRAYADSLGKPSERLYVSHRHPDHWFGVGTAFSDVEVYALSQTVDFFIKDGQTSINDHQKKLGDLAPKSLVIPQNVTKAGVEIIDGVTYKFGLVTDTEIDYHLTLELPHVGVYFAQDLIYSGTHLYLTKDMAHWAEVLQSLLVSDYEMFMPGHGLPADKNEVARNIEYLLAAKQAYDRGLTNVTFAAYLIGRYPERRCPGIFDIYIPRLFDGAPQA